MKEKITLEKMPAHRLILIVFLASLSTLSLFIAPYIPTSADVENSYIPVLAHTGVPVIDSLHSALARFVIKFSLVMPGASMSGLVAFCALIALYAHYFKLRGNGEIPRSKTFLVLSTLFAAIMVAGFSVKNFDSLAFILENGFQAIYSSIIFAGYVALFHVALGLLLRMIEKSTCPRSLPQRLDNIATFILDRRSFLGPFCFLLLCWLPIWVIHLPASVQWDTIHQFNNYFGIFEWTNHHPIFSSLIYGVLMRTGRLLWNDNFGLFLCALLQHLMFSGSMAYCFCSLKDRSRTARFVCLLFLGLCPLVSFWPHSVTKDCLYAPLLLMFMMMTLQLLDGIKNDGVIPLKRCLKIITLAVLISIVRHNGIYVVILSFLAMCLVKMPPRMLAKIVASAALVIVCASTVSNSLIEAYHAPDISTGWAFSVLFQQTARYVRDHGDEVTADEREAIDAVLLYDELPAVYDSNISDPVGLTYRGDDSKLPAYFKIWFQMLLKHPKTYIEATLSNSYSYFYPMGESTRKPLLYNHIQCDRRVNTGEFDFHYVSPLIPQVALDRAMASLNGMPGLGTFMHLGTYTWLFFIVLAFVIYRKKWYMLVGSCPIILNLLCCVVSPVNGYLRYFFPNIILGVIFTLWAVGKREDVKIQKES